MQSEARVAFTYAVLALVWSWSHSGNQIIRLLSPQPNISPFEKKNAMGIWKHLKIVLNL